MLRNALYPIGAIGNSFIRHIHYLLNLIAFCAYLIRISFTLKNGERDRFYQRLVQQIYESGIKNIFIFTIIGLLLGMLAILQIHHQIAKAMGLGNLGATLNTVIIKELSAFIPAIFVILSSGVSVTSDIGHMNSIGRLDISDEGIRLNILPRFWAIMICIPSLLIYFDITSLLGGYLLANLIAEIPFPSFYDSLTQAINISDFALSIIKAIIFALIIATISIYQGLKEGKNNISDAAIHCLFYCFILDIIISVISYLPG